MTDGNFNIVLSKNENVIDEEKIKENSIISENQLLVETKIDKDYFGFSYLDLIPYDGLFDKDSYNELINECKYKFQPIHIDANDEDFYNSISN